MDNTILQKVSYHAVYDESIIDALKYACDNGFAGIQIAVEAPHLLFENLSDKNIEEIVQFTNSKGMYTTLHAPDNTASLFQCSRYLSEGVMNYYRALFSFAGAIGSKAVTVHPGAMTTYPTDEETERVIPRTDIEIYETALKRNFEELLKIAGGRFNIYVENCRIGLAELEMLNHYLRHDNLFLCWDLAKSASDPEIEDFYFAHPELIKQVHLHDRIITSDSVYKSHRSIGTGEIDFGRYLKFLLKKADVEDFCIEVRPREKAKESLLALKEIIRQMGIE